MWFMSDLFWLSWMDCQVILRRKNNIIWHQLTTMLYSWLPLYSKHWLTVLVWSVLWCPLRPYSGVTFQSISLTPLKGKFVKNRKKLQRVYIRSRYRIELPWNTFKRYQPSIFPSSCCNRASVSIFKCEAVNVLKETKSNEKEYLKSSCDQANTCRHDHIQGKTYHIS